MNDNNNILVHKQSVFYSKDSLQLLWKCAEAKF